MVNSERTFNLPKDSFICIDVDRLEAINHHSLQSILQLSQNTELIVPLNRKSTVELRVELYHIYSSQSRQCHLAMLFLSVSELLLSLTLG